MDKAEKREALVQLDKEIEIVKADIAAGDTSFESKELLKLLLDERAAVLSDKIDEEEYND